MAIVDVTAFDGMMSTMVKAVRLKSLIADHAWQSFASRDANILPNH